MKQDHFIITITGISRGKYGYQQKGNRYFWKRGTEICYTHGFKSKIDADKWIEEERNISGFEWRVGFMVKFKAYELPWVLVDRNNIEVKAF